MKIKTEKYRIAVSRVAAAVGLFFLCSTQSYWKAKNETVTFFLFFIGVFLVAVAVLGRMWCSLYIAGYKNKKLVTEGPYSICRNPLYLFSMIGMVGIGCTTETFTFPGVFLALFALYYPVVIKSEENRLKQLFGVEFEAYTRRVPAFFPRVSTFTEPENYTVNPAVYRRHIYSAVWFVWIVGILQAIEGMRGMGLFTPLLLLY